MTGLRARYNVGVMRPLLPRLRVLALLALLALLAMSAFFAAPGCESDSGCSDDFDCDGAQVCRKATGSCQVFVCKVAADCGAGQTCDDNECVTP